MTILLAVLLLVGPADAGDDDGPTDPPPPSEVTAEQPDTEPAPSARERLEVAIRYYHSGHRDQARRALAELVNDDGVDDIEMRQEARVYLGEVFLVQGDRASAHKTWELVLQDDPEYRLDPFRHPPDIVSEFEVVRAFTIPLTEPGAVGRPEPAPRQPAPLSVYAGFGLYQLGHGRPASGVLLLVGQTATAAISIATFASLASDHAFIAGSDEIDDLRLLRGIQWGSTLAFWTLYSGGAVSARRVWVRDVRDAPARLDLSVTPGGLRLAGTF